MKTESTDSGLPAQAPSAKQPKNPERKHKATALPKMAVPCGAQRLALSQIQKWESLGYGMFIHFGMSTFDGCSTGRIFSPASIALLAEASQGNPRTLNLLSQAA